MWGFSSAGRAPALQAGGQRFDPANLQYPKNVSVFGSPTELHILGRNEFGLRQGFATQNAWDAGPPAGDSVGIAKYKYGPVAQLARASD